MTIYRSNAEHRQSQGTQEEIWLWPFIEVKLNTASPRENEKTIGYNHCLE